MNLNPNHPTSQIIGEHWHTIVALLVNRAGGHLVISQEDVNVMPNDVGLAIQELSDGLHLTLISADDARRIAKEQGGIAS